MSVISGVGHLLTIVPKVHKGPPRRVIATPDEITRVIAVAPGWLRCAILLAAHAAFRRSDCLRAAPIHYHSEAGVLTIQQEKTGHEVTVPVSTALQTILNSAPTGPPTTPFVELYRGRRVTKDMLDKTWQKVRRQSGINPQITFHDLRRTVAVALYEVSKDLRIVEQMLGHRSLHATIQYLEHRDPSKLKPYLDSLWPMDRAKGPVQ
jgi:integrase